MYYNYDVSESFSACQYSKWLIILAMSSIVRYLKLCFC